jgi:hypothetical protein
MNARAIFIVARKYAVPVASAVRYTNALAASSVRAPPGRERREDAAPMFLCTRNAANDLSDATPTARRFTTRKTR